MMRFLPASLILTLLVSLPLQAADKPGSVQWTPFTQATQNAASKGKYVFVDIYTDWCEYCKQLDAVTFHAPTVLAELDKHFVSSKLNAESDVPLVWKGRKMTASKLASLWQVDGFPTLMFLNSKGEIIGSFSSYADPKLMVKLLTYISSGARERKVSFEDYVKASG
jgi:thioredoxin-related protein